MNHVMNVVRKIVNYIRSNAFHHWQFKEFLRKLSSKYSDACNILPMVDKLWKMFIQTFLIYGWKLKADEGT